MWFPSSNNVSVIYERPTTIPAQPPQHCTISSPYHNKLTPNSALTHIHPKEACTEGQCVFTVHACVLQRTARVQASSNSFYAWTHVWTCEKRRHMYATHHLVGAWRLCLLAGLNCLIVLIVLREGQRETVSRVDSFLDATLKVKEQETSMKKRRSIFWLNRYETETLEADCTEPRGWISVEKHKHLNENRIWHCVDSNFSKHCRK